ncbi:ABC transporter ATP-binding protein [Spirochaetia bacterium]|nr:ABC transporter ATP-binding protein [Spirochaetia bacterium]
MNTPLIETKGIRKYFKTQRGLLHAVEDVNLTVEAGQTLGVVGESGCGKSTLGRLILGLVDATAGEVLLEGKNIVGIQGMKKRDMYNNIQMIFQDPFTSLNPRFSISNIIEEPLINMHKTKNPRELRERVTELMDIVGLPKRYYNTYPHELDGGRRQRVGLARALALNPQFIVCDEPVSALDVSIQAQILNLLMDLQDKQGLSYMFITHNLCVVKHISDFIMVMYMGQVVEYASTEDLFKEPQHPYTRALLSSIPLPDLSYRNRERSVLHGEVSSPINPAPGCRFAPRCPNATDKCVGRDLPLKDVKTNHKVACTLFE